MTTTEQWLEALAKAGAYIPPSRREEVRGVISAIHHEASSQAPPVPRGASVIAHPPSRHPADFRSVRACFKIKDTTAIVWRPAWFSKGRWHHKQGLIMLKWVETPPTAEEMQTELESAWFGRTAKTTPPATAAESKES